MGDNGRKQKDSCACRPRGMGFLMCFSQDQIKQHKNAKDIQELKRQRDELREQLEQLEEPDQHRSGSRVRRPGRTKIGGSNLARPRPTRPRRSEGDDANGGRFSSSMGGSMDEAAKMQGTIDLLKEQQKIQKEAHTHTVLKKDEELKAKDIEIHHLRERLEKMEAEQAGIRDKARRADEQSDQIDAMHTRVKALEKQIVQRDEKIRNLDTNPEKFMQLQKYVHEELTRYVERIMRSLEECRKQQKEAYSIISELRKAITIEIARKVEVLGKKLEASSEEGDAWGSRLSQQDVTLQKLKKELRELRAQTHKVDVTFEAFKQQQSLQKLQTDSASSVGSGPSPLPESSLKSSTSEPSFDQKQQQQHKFDGMKADVSRIDAAAIARQEQVDSMIENNTFMKKELDKRSQETESSISELLTVSRKNSNANSYVNDATRRLDNTQSRLDDQIQPAATRADKLVTNLSEKMLAGGGNPADIEHLSRSSPGGYYYSGEGDGSQSSSWLGNFSVLNNIKFTWD
mmetsp:Transcript_34796/g.48588  ORF Transcript_34796/g.48588 Transcript_34796/m.48588 type:complete len:515 (-) Transcript_34796:255-1799(-)